MKNRAAPGDWVAHANCRTDGNDVKRDVDAMTMPSHRGRNAKERNAAHIENARRICAACAVLEQCKAWALTKPDDPAYGLIAGGLTPAERGTSDRPYRRSDGAPPRVTVVDLKPRLVMTDNEVEHGQRYWYNKGCRCEACTLAAVEYSRRWREKRKRTA